VISKQSTGYENVAPKSENITDPINTRLEALPILNLERQSTVAMHMYLSVLTENWAANSETDS